MDKVLEILDSLEAEIKREYEKEPTDEMRLMVAGGIGTINILRAEILRMSD